MSKITRSELVRMVAERLADVQAQFGMRTVFAYEQHLDYYEDCDDEILIGDAIVLNVIKDETNINLEK
jgi:hypothetical protein